MGGARTQPVPPPSRSSLAAFCWLTPARLIVQTTGRNLRCASGLSAVLLSLITTRSPSGIICVGSAMSCPSHRQIHSVLQRGHCLLAAALARLDIGSGAALGVSLDHSALRPNLSPQCVDQQPSLTCPPNIVRTEHNAFVRS